MGKLVTTEEVAEFLQVSERTIMRWRKEGLPHKRLGYNICRYDLIEVRRWVDERSSK